ncbi:hypothetical protein BDN71DRAFT_1429673 [Pleurotus eryngii]|uniref:Uncharacterized protein n=1 Tax=Pleurotus eryngii TaxID=5323 RepID=A0A9P6A0Z8_PLEER|nr:hypothetical protein BDN71DRAFT_1429673 [Pleurotus eryngii]
MSLTWKFKNKFSVIACDTPILETQLCGEQHLCVPATATSWKSPQEVSAVMHDPEFSNGVVAWLRSFPNIDTSRGIHIHFSFEPHRNQAPRTSRLYERIFQARDTR